MRPFQIFAAMEPERADGFFRAIAKESPAMFGHAVGAAAVSLKSRPAFVAKQPMDKKTQTLRRAMSRVAMNSVAEEMLAVYFIEIRKELLVEWLDAVGVKHTDGALEADSPEEPDGSVLAEAVKTYRAADDDADRELLLRAFAAQSSVEWPNLNALLDAD